MKKSEKRVALHNLGCKVNSYETDAMAKCLAGHGYRLVPFSETADIYIVNTCTVTNIADRKSRQMLHKAKKQNPKAVVVAVGCYAQAAGEALLEDGAVDIIVGNNKKQDIVKILEEYEKNREMRCQILPAGEWAYEEAFGMNEANGHVRAYIKIQDGCNQFCSYCIIPYVRGRIRSRSMEDMIREIRVFAKKGYQEIVLTGIHLSSYGLDVKENSFSLLDAIKECASVEGIRRIRLGSLEPGIVTEEFVKELAGEKKFCPQFHLSLQSGCDATLKRMNRKYTSGEYSEKCRLIREYFPDAAITTDVIVGFPGETGEEFEETKEFLKKTAFSAMHIFKYSKRNGTRAATMENQVDDRVKNERSAVLIELEKSMRSAYMEKFLGKDVEVLAEETLFRDGKEYCTGYTREYIRVLFPAGEAMCGRTITLKGKAIVYDKPLKEEILLAEI